MSELLDEVEPIAVVGMALRVPGARTVDEYWRLIVEGREAITWFDERELRESGVSDALLADPDYVRAAGWLPDADRFDAEFFGLSPAEAAMLDPQHRLFLTTSWEALEDAGHDAGRFDGAIGVYAGTFMNKYLAQNLLTNKEFARTPQAYFARNFNDKDFLAGRLAYLMDLRGPAITVQTACSTSLVATHLACQALLSFDCDLALVGGVALNLPLKAGYLALDGTMFSADGKCRPFDTQAGGTLPGNGAVMVALRRLSDAVADGDHIRAVIRGTAINNDGNAKVSFTAPSLRAQAAVITAAQAVAGVAPSTIGYVEAHGTGTPLGDPIEVAALTTAFQARTDRVGYCALGSVKANIGHLDAAAGVAGLARAVLALENGVIPPQANFREPNPQLKLDGSAFYVPTAPTEWVGERRRAAVSSFGVGGTNAHAILEQAPSSPSTSRVPDRKHLIVISARDRAALDSAGSRLAEHLSTHAALELADVAQTLASGRQGFAWRRIAVAARPAEVGPALAGQPALRHEPGHREAVFLFPGVGTQYPDMALEIYDSEPVFAAEVDKCAALLETGLGLDLRRYLFPSRFPGPALDREDVPNVVCAVFTISYSMARLWESWGVRPAAMLGHSLGEYVAACLAGVLDLPDALDLTVRRGELFRNIPDGRMMAVPLSEVDLIPLLDESLSLGAVNAPGFCLVSGRQADIDVLAKRLAAKDVRGRVLPVRMASHSYLVEPYLADFTRTVAGYRLREPSLPYLSCLTGDWIQPGQATDPAYWAKQLRSPVRFADAVRTVLDRPGRVLLEVGPGNTLTTLVGAQRLAPPPVAVASLRHPDDARADMEVLLGALGRLWQAGVEPDWRAVNGANARRVPLPAYPFHERRHWIEAGNVTLNDPQVPGGQDAIAEPAVTEVPMTGRERAIADAWCELLGLQAVDVNDDFVALGGHSLLAAQMLRRLRPLTSASLSVVDLFSAPTIAQLAAMMQRREQSGAPVSDDRSEVLAADVVLAEDIQAAGLEPARVGSPVAVLLTGATGFLGAFLAAELLTQTEATVYCLVRAPDRHTGEERILEALRSYGLPTPADGRVIAVPGDLAQPRLGLSQDDYDSLATEVDAIYHCGAWVNFVRPYEMLRPANVAGTQELLRLATSRRLKWMHHISTIFVNMGGVAAGAAEIEEDATLAPPVGHDTGYTESKWVAEGVARIAAERGIPVAVYRPGNILADAHTGAANAEDYLTKVVQGCVQLGAAPVRDYPLPASAVDFVARAIVEISLREDAIGRTYHLINPEPLPWNRIFHAVRAAGYQLPSIAWRDWCALLAERLDQGHDNALAPLSDMLHAPEDRAMPRFDTRNAASAGLSYSTFDDDYFATMLRYFTRSGWLPAERQDT